MSVPVYPVSSFREEMGFVILHHKCSEIYWNEQLFSLYFTNNAKIVRAPEHRHDTDLQRSDGHYSGKGFGTECSVIRWGRNYFNDS